MDCGVAWPLSPQAVGAYDQRVQRAEGTHASSAPVRLLHAAAEDTGLEAESVDLVQPHLLTALDPAMHNAVRCASCSSCRGTACLLTPSASTR